jgi:predicted AAA+ superfamily ATPase
MLDKDKIMEAISDWNYWGKDLPSTIRRKTYEDEIARKASSGEILVIKGVRRSGKSTLLINEIKRHRSEGRPAKDILLVNLEDPRFVNHLNPALLDRIKDTYLEFMAPDNKPIIMLDEVQNVPGWEKWALKEYGLRQSSLYITGSSSALLSPEVGTALSGRYLDVTVFPLSFAEFLHFNQSPIHDRAERLQNRTQVDRLFARFIEQGGFPKLIEIPDAETRRDTLKAYYDSILLRDIIARHKIANHRALEELTVFLLSNIASCNSTNKLKNNLGISFDSVKDYTHYLEQACLIFQLPRFAWSVKKQLANPRKFYSVDTGLCNRVSFQVGARRAQNLENIVFIELLRRKREIYYYKTGQDLEIDFVVKQGAQIVELIQVCHDLEAQKTRRRELKAFEKAQAEIGGGKAIRKTLLTLEPHERSDLVGQGVEVQNVIDWLLFPWGSGSI